MKGDELPKVWLCPVHCQKLWLPYPGICPVPGCYQQLVGYAMVARVAIDGCVTCGRSMTRVAFDEGER